MNFSLNNVQIELIWPWVAAGFAALLLLLGIWLYLYKTATKRRIRKVIRQLGETHLTDILIPDGLGGQIQIDYLVNMPGGLLILDFINLDGNLFGGEKLDQWAQVQGMRTHRFRNPLYDNQMRAASVRDLVPEVPVVSRVVFSPTGSFPKGMPEGISMLDQLAKDIEAEVSPKALPDGVRSSVWEKIKAEAASVHA